MASGPLSGLRVVEMTGDHGRLAGKMLTEAGASVVRVGPAFAGPAMSDPAVAARGGLLDWWFDGGKDIVARRCGERRPDRPPIDASPSAPTW